MRCTHTVSSFVIKFDTTFLWKLSQNKERLARSQIKWITWEEITLSTYNKVLHFQQGLFLSSDIGVGIWGSTPRYKRTVGIRDSQQGTGTCLCVLVR